MLSSHLSQRFFKTLVDWCSANRIKPDHVLMILFSESGLSPWAAARSKTGTIVAAGISQIIPANLPSLGYHGAPEEFIKLSAEQQLPFALKYFSRYLALGLTEAHQIYATNFLPARCTGNNWKEDGYVLCGGRGSVPAGQEILQWAYDANRVLDHNKDGFITMGDLKDHLFKVCSGAMWREVLGRLYSEVNPNLINWSSVQQRLKDAGFYAGAVDGVPGPITCRAVNALLDHK